MTQIDSAVFMAALAGPGRVVETSVRGLEELWPPAPDRLRLAFMSAGAEIDECDAIELVVSIGERLGQGAYFRELFAHGAEDAQFEAFLDLRREGSGLLIDAELKNRLPLIPLASSIAGRSGTLKVELVDSDRIKGLWGCARRLAGVGDLVLLADGRADNELAETFAHELAHLLDPIESADQVWHEAFAEDLGPRLLEEDPSSTLDAAPLIGLSLEAVRGFRRRVPASPGLDALLDWALGELPKWGSVVELIAAHPASSGPGVNVPAEATPPFTSPPVEGRPMGDSSSFESPVAPASGPDDTGGEC